MLCVESSQQHSVQVAFGNWIHLVLLQPLTGLLFPSSVPVEGRNGGWPLVLLVWSEPVHPVTKSQVGMCSFLLSTVVSKLRVGFGVEIKFS